MALQTAQTAREVVRACALAGDCFGSRRLRVRSRRSGVQTRRTFGLAEGPGSGAVDDRDAGPAAERRRLPGWAREVCRRGGGSLGRPPGAPPLSAKRQPGRLRLPLDRRLRLPCGVRVGGARAGGGARTRSGSPLRTGFHPSRIASGARFGGSSRGVRRLWATGRRGERAAFVRATAGRRDSRRVPLSGFRRRVVRLVSCARFAGSRGRRVPSRLRARRRAAYGRGARSRGGAANPLRALKRLSARNARSSSSSSATASRARFAVPRACTRVGRCAAKMRARLHEQTTDSDVADGIAGSQMCPRSTLARLTVSGAGGSLRIRPDAAWIQGNGVESALVTPRFPTIEPSRCVRGFGVFGGSCVPSRCALGGEARREIHCR